MARSQLNASLSHYLILSDEDCRSIFEQTNCPMRTTISEDDAANLLQSLFDHQIISHVRKYIARDDFNRLLASFKKIDRKDPTRKLEKPLEKLRRRFEKSRDLLFPPPYRQPLTLAKARHYFVRELCAQRKGQVPLVGHPIKGWRLTHDSQLLAAFSVIFNQKPTITVEGVAYRFMNAFYETAFRNTKSAAWEGPNRNLTPGNFYPRDRMKGALEISDKKAVGLALLNNLPVPEYLVIERPDLVAELIAKFGQQDTQSEKG